MTTKYLVSNSDGFNEEVLGYSAAEFVSTSAGVGDAGKPIVLDAAGKIDSTMIDLGAIDHGALTGLGDDDHTQYILVDGTRAFTGDQSMGSNKITSLADGTANGDAVNFGQLQAYTSGLQDFRESIIDKDLTAPPGSPTTGDRYIVAATATGAWVGLEKKIVEYNGATWDVEADPDEGTYVYVEDEDAAYIFNNNVFASGSWVLFNAGIYSASLGVELVGNDFRLDLLASGGLKLTGNEVGIEPNDFAGDGLVDDGADNMAIDWATTFTIDGADAKAFKASDIASTTNGKGAAIVGIEDASAYYTGTDLETALNELEAQIGGATSATYDFIEANVLTDNDSIYPALNKLDLKWGDLASTASTEGASLVGIEDTGSYFTGTTVEAALQELGLKADENEDFVEYTVGAGGVTIGDLCYISANDTVLPYATLTQAHRGIGLAYTTESAAATVRVVANDEVIAGALTGATAGDPYYWDGSALSTTIPSSSGSHVWQAGVAKNATDLHVEVRFVKKNA
jgi:hypothetical protein